MDSSLSYLSTTERQTRMEAAQNEVLEWELSDTIIDEHYTKDEYFNRRFYFLGRHPNYRTVLRLAPIARADAELVFTSRHTMPVQAVRQIELQHHICPLLPLPTTANVQTADDTFHLGPRNIISPSPQRARAYQMGGALRNAPRDPEILAQIIRDLGYPLGTRRHPPPGYRAEQGVSAVGNRPIFLPVKTPPKVSAKRRHAQIESGDEQLRGSGTDHASEGSPARGLPSPGPAKRPRTTGTTLLAGRANHATGAPTGRPRIKLAAQRKAGGGGGAAPPPRNGTLASVVSGARLPKSIREATEAAVQRRQALERANSGGGSGGVRNLDLAPEFFSRDNFTAEEKTGIGSDSGGPIRCICGEGEVAGKADWIQCDGDGCGVWQHVVCMEDAVQKTEKQRQAARYLCQVCSPWAHRRTIQRLRRGDPDPVARAEAEAEGGNDDDNDDDDDDDEDDH